MATLVAFMAPEGRGVQEFNCVVILVASFALFMKEVLDSNHDCFTYGVDVGRSWFDFQKFCCFDQDFFGAP